MRPHENDEKSPSKRKRGERREGAAMLAVLLLILMSTLTGMVAIHSSTFELRTVGTERRMMQTHYIAEGALGATLAMVDSMGPVALRIGLSRNTLAPTARLAPEEPMVGRAMTNYRITLQEFPSLAGVTANTLETDPLAGPSLGPMLGVAPDFAVDVNDDYVVASPIAGHRSDGYGVLRFMMATYTARGRTAPIGAATEVDGGGNAVWRRGIHETAANSRAYALSGPFPWED